MFNIHVYFEYQITDFWQIKAAVQIFETNSFRDFNIYFQYLVLLLIYDKLCC